MTGLLDVARVGRRRLRQVLGRDPVHRPEIHCNSLRLGSEYGGWTIHPDIIAADSVIYSFGVGTDVSFDLALIERFGVTVHAFDPSPRSIAWVASQALPASFIFHRFGVSNFDGELNLFPPPNDQHVSYSIINRHGQRGAVGEKLSVYRLQTIMCQLGHDRLDVLKMDIEGSEYAVIDDLLDNGVTARQILVEFHHRFPGIGVPMTDRAVSRLREHGYQLFSVANAEEYSFLHAR